VAVVLVAINTFGGFLVTERMLEMFKKKDPKK
jgi:NAD(P) transhydrogenase subunit alpha